MKKLIATVALLVVAASVFSQSLYSDRILRNLGLSEDQIEKITEAEREAAESVRILRAELAIKKAELARILLDQSPNMRAVERNLRETADIEVRIRMNEIERELAIRDIVGAERWSRIVQAVRERRQAAAARAGEAVEDVRERLGAIAGELRERQEQLQRALRDRPELDESGEIREQLRDLHEEYLELQELIRERL
jgi:hypothetical protein